MALLTLDPDAALRLAATHGLDATDPAFTQAPAVQSAAAAAVDAVNAGLARHEQVKRFAVLPQDFSQAAGEVTPTMKLRRRHVAERYAAEIDALYASA